MSPRSLSLPGACVLALAAGCIDPQYGEAPFACVEMPSCPEGFRCIDGVCRSKPIDASADSASADAGADVRPPDTSAEGPSPDGGPRPFGSPQPLTKLNSSAIDTHPSLTADMLEIFFQSARVAGGGHKQEHDIWTARRASATDEWSSPSRIGTISSAQLEATPEVSADGLTLFFAGNRQGGSVSDIFVSTRPTRDGDWSSPQRVPELSSTKDDSSPTPSKDLRFLIMASARPGGPGSVDLYAATRTLPTGKWGAPALFDAVNSSAMEAAPWIDDDRTVLYFTSDRSGGAGKEDIWAATRPSTSDPWGTPAPVVELNSTGNDAGAWVSPDRSVVVFCSDRNGDMDLFLAQR